MARSTNDKPPGERKLKKRREELTKTEREVDVVDNDQ
jgi:hypothetical protein